MASLFIGSKFSATNANGAPLAGGKVYSYLAGTLTLQATYTDQAGLSPNTNPVILDAAGRANIWLGSGTYRFIVKDASDVLAPDGDTDNITSPATAAALSAYSASVAAASGASLVGFVAGGAGVTRTAEAKMRERVSVNDFGADPTGANLSNAAFDLAKAQSKTLILSAGTYRLENYTIQDVRLIGARASGSNVGANEQTIIEGSGDLLVGANNFALEHLVIRNSSSGTRGKLITVSNIDTKIGPFIDVDFRKAAYHVFQNDATKALVDVVYRDCHFTDANIYSRSYAGGLFRYAEENCNTQACKRAMLIQSTSAAEIGGVFELMDEGAIYITNTVTATDAIRGLKFKNIHFEQNGHVTPTADVTVNVTMSLARIEFDSCGFYLPSVAKAIELSSSPTLRIFHHNCTDIDFNNVAAGAVIASATPKQAGLTNGFYSQNGDIGTSGVLYASGGFRALSGISVTITGSATPTPIAMPAAGATRLVIVADSTTAGGAVLMLNNSVVTSISSTLTSITWSVVSGVLNGQTSGGASSRVLFFNFLST